MYNALADTINEIIPKIGEIRITFQGLVLVFKTLSTFVSQYLNLLYKHDNGRF